MNYVAALDPVVLTNIQTGNITSCIYITNHSENITKINSIEVSIEI